MDNAIYATLNRQSGLMREMRSVANNMANSATTGFRREGIIFSEFVAGLGADAPSLSMANAGARHIDLHQAGLTTTNGTYDFAIEGEGFFQIDDNGQRFLTRAGAFIPSAEGELLTPEGARLLDAGGAPVVVPANAGSVALAQDGTLSADGVPIAEIGVVLPGDKGSLRHESGTRFSTSGEVVPAEQAQLVQGALEDSNVDPVAEIARMIEVQRAYEMGQSFLQREDDRIKSVISMLSR